MEKRRNCSSGAISLLFHNIFNIYFLLKESNYIVICKIWLFKVFFPQNYKSDMSKYGYLELFFEGPFEFEITRVDCILRSEGTLLHLKFFSVINSGILGTCKTQYKEGICLVLAFSILCKGLLSQY